MKKKAFIISIVAMIISLFSVSYTFAAGNMQDGIRGAVGGAENVLEGAGNAVGRAVQSGVNTISNGTKGAGDTAQNTVGAMTNNSNNNSGNNNNGYTATRTMTTRGVTDNVQDTTTMYTWVIIGITAVGIGVLLWSYFRQNNANNLYIDSNDK